MPPLRSTSLAAADYDPETEELVITFHNGLSYTYDGVPEQVYQDLLAAASPGTYYHAVIKGTYG